MQRIRVPEWKEAQARQGDQAHSKQPWKCPVGKHVQGHNGGLKGMRAEAVVEERKEEDGPGPEENACHIKEIELLFEPQIQFKSL